MLNRKREFCRMSPSAKRTFWIFVVLCLGLFSAAYWLSGGHPEIISPLSDVVAVYEGGKFGETKDTYTPFFDVRPDWSLEIAARGSITPMSLEAPDGSGLYLHGGTRTREGTTKYEYTDGGKFRVHFTGNGVWRVIIHQGSGKL
jgi:hypothetical protein